MIDYSIGQSVVKDESDASHIVEESSKFVGWWGRKKALFVTNDQSVESMSLIRHNLSLNLTDSLYVTDCNSQNTIPLNAELQFHYKNKALP